MHREKGRIILLQQSTQFPFYFGKCGFPIDSDEKSQFSQKYLISFDLRVFRVVNALVKEACLICYAFNMVEKHFWQCSIVVCAQKLAFIERF